MLAVAAGVLSTATASDATAQTVAPDTTPAVTPISLYRTYQAALDANNFSAAADFGLQAWQAARDRYPDTNPNKAALAYNAAWALAMMGRYADALAPASAAVTLSAYAGQAYEPRLAGFLHAVAHYKTDRALPPSEQQRLTTLIQDYAGSVMESSELDAVVPVALTAAAWAALSNRDFTNLSSLSNLALSGFAVLDVRQGQPLADAYMARAVSYSSSFQRLRSEEGLQNALMDSIRARQAFGTVPLDAPFTYYAAQAWAAAVMAVALTSDDDRRLVFPADVEIPQPGGLMCPQLERMGSLGREVVYPAYLSNDGMAGGAVILARLRADGTIESTAVGASIPNAQFGVNAAEAVRTWRYRMPTGFPAACLENYRITVIYTLGYR